MTKIIGHRQYIHGHNIDKDSEHGPYISEHTIVRYVDMAPALLIVPCPGILTMALVSLNSHGQSYEHGSLHMVIWSTV